MNAIERLRTIVNDLANSALGNESLAIEAHRIINRLNEPAPALDVEALDMTPGTPLATLTAIITDAVVSPEAFGPIRDERRIPVYARIAKRAAAVLLANGFTLTAQPAHALDVEALLWEPYDGHPDEGRCLVCGDDGVHRLDIEDAAARIRAALNELAPALDVAEDGDHFLGCPACEHCTCAGVTRKSAHVHNDGWCDKCVEHGRELEWDATHD